MGDRFTRSNSICAPATARYLNLLVYLFRTEILDTHEPRLVMVAQFKTTPSGDPITQKQRAWRGVTMRTSLKMAMRFA